MIDNAVIETELKKIGKEIEAGIKGSEISINGLEKMSGVSKTIIYKILRGENYEIRGLLKVCNVLNIDIDFDRMRK